MTYQLTNEVTCLNFLGECLELPCFFIVIWRMTKVFNVKENKNDAVHNNAENMHLVMHALYLNFLSYNTKTAEGKDIIHKFYQMKLKLNTERIGCISKATYCKLGSRWKL